MEISRHSYSLLDFTPFTKSRSLCMEISGLVLPIHLPKQEELGVWIETRKAIRFTSMKRMSFQGPGGGTRNGQIIEKGILYIVFSHWNISLQSPLHVPRANFLAIFRCSQLSCYEPTKVLSLLTQSPKNLHFWQHLIPTWPNLTEFWSKIYFENKWVL